MELQRGDLGGVEVTRADQRPISVWNGTQTMPISMLASSGVLT
jgi:hypothetical protein